MSAAALSSFACPSKIPRKDDPITCGGREGRGGEGKGRRGEKVGVREEGRARKRKVEKEKGEGKGSGEGGGREGKRREILFN